MLSIYSWGENKNSERFRVMVFVTYGRALLSWRWLNLPALGKW